MVEIEVYELSPYTCILTGQRLGFKVLQYVTKPDGDREYYGSRYFETRGEAEAYAAALRRERRDVYGN